ncbi:PEPxxWA-CTERM sorting domain-containing protein [Phenylobacterium sp.]|uniref:PEPxxWA-CTERM sorting domain-containing protein n=1 Tax=Phenylobacterium sp. TaxID=1871053 RepID=UPI003D2AE026
MARHSWLGISVVAALAIGAPSPAAAVIGFDVGGQTYLTGQNSQVRSHTANLMLLNASYGGAIGGVAGEPPYAFGAEIHGSATPKLGFQANAVSGQVANFGTTATATTLVRGADGMASSKIGESFTLATTLSQGSSNYMDVDSRFSADLRLVHGLKLEAGGSGCLGGCLYGDLKVNLGQGSTYLMGVTEAGNANVFGVDVGGPSFSYTDPSKILTVSGAAPNFDAKTTNVAGGPAIVSRQGLVSVSVDAAQAFATAVGLPFPLKGEIAGFDYTILSAKIGAGFDIVKKVAFETVSAGVNYAFSAPVQVFDTAKNTWSDLTTSWFTAANGAELQVRAPGAASIGVTRYDVLGGNMVTSLDLVGYVSGSLQALGLSGYGLEFGPLLDKTIAFDIGTIEMNRYSEFTALTQVGQTFNLTFDSNRFEGQDPCAGGCSITGFVDTRNFRDVDVGGFELSDSTIRLVDNLGGRCVSGGIDNQCTFRDDLFAPIARQVLVDQVDPGNEGSGEDILAFRGALAAPDFLATQSDADQVIARLRALGVDPFNPQKLPGMGPGAPFPTTPILESERYSLTYGPGVPEPSTWLLLIGGMGLAGASLRRRRAALALAA